MVIDFTTGGLSESVYENFLFLLNGGKASPISYFGSNREFLEDMTHNIFRGEYVS
jgi:hypothetical protein